MFPFYAQQSYPYYPNQMSQNDYLNMLQQGFQVNPNFNTMVQVPQTFYINYAQYQQIPNTTVIQPPSVQIHSDSMSTIKCFSCNCVNTDCRKQYCICFKNGQICRPKCGCTNCRNRELHERNVPLEKKQHVSCNCKKSECAKKYCECYANGIKCNESCQCKECKNC